jgi:HlyD family secretion protein
MPNSLPGISISLAALTLALGSGCKRSGAGAIKYETVPVTRGAIVQHVSASGTLSAVVSVDVGSQVSGKVSALYADFNSPVKKDALVAEIDPTIYAAQLAQAKADLANANAANSLAKVTLERDAKLLDNRILSQAMVIIKQAMLESAQANLGYCKITAPVDGIVIARKVDLGQTVNAAMNTPVLFTVAQSLTRMNISAAISEADIGQVRNGQSVDFNVDAFPDEVFHGEVTQVRKSPTTTQNVVTYETIITVDNPEQKLFPGMTADVSILVAERTNALKIPNTALRYTPPEGATFEQTPSPIKLQRNQRLVYALAAGGAKLKPAIVRTGITDGVETEILEGLVPGDQVVTSTLIGGATGGFGGGPPPPGP